MTDALNSRESIEALETTDPAARNSRESIEVLHNVFVTGLVSRDSIENLWQFPSVVMRDSRLSIEVLEGPILSVSKWGAVEM